MRTAIFEVHVVSVTGDTKEVKYIRALSGACAKAMVEAMLLAADSELMIADEEPEIVDEFTITRMGLTIHDIPMADRLPSVSDQFGVPCIVNTRAD